MRTRPRLSDGVAKPAGKEKIVMGTRPRSAWAYMVRGTLFTIGVCIMYASMVHNWELFTYVPLKTTDLHYRW